MTTLIAALVINISMTTVNGLLWFRHKHSLSAFSCGVSFVTSIFLVLACLSV